MSASLRRERAWWYPAEGPADEATGTTYRVAPASTPDGAYACSYAPQNGRESTVALRRTAIGRAVFGFHDTAPVTGAGLLRLQRTGVLYEVTDARTVPQGRTLLADAQTVERGVYEIAEDVPQFTAANVLISPPSLTIGTGPNAARLLRATVTNADNRVLPDRPIEWGVSDRNICNVIATGRVEGFNPGTAIVTARAGDVIGTATVTVVE